MRIDSKPLGMVHRICYNNFHVKDNQQKVRNQVISTTLVIVPVQQLRKYLPFIRTILVFMALQLPWQNSHPHY